MTVDRRADLQELIAWFKENYHKLPKKPFRMGMWTNVLNPPAFFAQLKEDIENYPGGLRQGNIREVLEDLRTYCEPEIC